MTQKDQVIKKELNIKEEVLDVAASKIHFHPGYVAKSEITDFLTENEAAEIYLTQSDANEDYLKKTHDILAVADNEENNQIKSGHIKITNNTTPINDNSLTITQKAILDYITNLLQNYTTDNELTEALQGITPNNPIITNLIFNNEINENLYNLPAGYYKIDTDEANTISIPPNDVFYKNGLLEIKQIGDEKIYHLYATSNINGTYKLNGQEYIKYGNNDWRIYKIPQKERVDLLKDAGKNVDKNSLTIYENTSGYIFNWKQNNNRFELPVDQNTWTSIYKYKNLPITGEYIFGNLIGHCDIKITGNEMFIRSIDKKDENIEGVNTTFFVPRNN